MKPETMKELLFSLAWFPFSNYHSTNVIGILKKEFPDTDMTDALKEFEKIYLSEPGPGSPK